MPQVRHHRTFGHEVLLGVRCPASRRACSRRIRAASRWWAGSIRTIGSPVHDHADADDCDAAGSNVTATASVRRATACVPSCPGPHGSGVRAGAAWWRCAHDQRAGDRGAHRLIGRGRLARDHLRTHRAPAVSTASATGEWDRTRGADPRVHRATVQHPLLHRTRVVWQLSRSRTTMGERMTCTAHRSAGEGRR